METLHDFHFFIGDGNDGTAYDHTVNGLTLEEAKRHALRTFVSRGQRKALRDAPTADGDSDHYTFEKDDEGAYNGGSSLIIDIHSRAGDIRSPESNGCLEDERQLTAAERARLRR